MRLKVSQLGGELPRLRCIIGPFVNTHRAQTAIVKSTFQILRASHHPSMDQAAAGVTQ